MTPLGCGAARRILWPDGRPQPLTPERAAAGEHLARCAVCRAFLGDMQRLAEDIARVAPYPSAPPEVRERLFQLIARARTHRRLDGVGRPVWWAASTALALVAGVWLGERAGRSSDPIVVFVDDHMRAMKGEGIASTDSLIVARWLASRLPFPVEIPLFPESQLRGARLCLMDGRRGAALEYDVRGQALSYYVIAHDTERPGDPPRRVRHAARGGYRVVTWHASGLTHAIVGSLPESRLTAFAHYCMQQMVALLAANHRGSPSPRTEAS